VTDWKEVEHILSVAWAGINTMKDFRVPQLVNHTLQSGTMLSSTMLSSTIWSSTIWSSTILSAILLSAILLSAILLSAILLSAILLSAILLSTIVPSAVLFVFLITIITLTLILITTLVVAVAVAIVLVFVVTATLLLFHGRMLVHVEDDTCIDELNLELHQHVLTLLRVHTLERSPTSWINVPQDLAPQIIFKFIAILAVIFSHLVLILIFYILVKYLLAEGSTIGVQAGVTMVAILVVTVAIVVSRTVLRAAVRAGPAFAADVAEAVSAFARDVVAGWVDVSVSFASDVRPCSVKLTLGKLNGGTADKALLVAFLVDCVLELLVEIIDLAGVTFDPIGK
jgi:hypothetical protein